MKRTWAVLMAVVCVLCAACGSSDGSGGDSGGDGSFVSKVDEHAQSVASDVELVLRKVVASDATGDYLNVASNADTLHENMQTFREELLGDADPGNDDHLDLIDAENTIKEGIGTIIRWTDDPTSPSLTARWSREVGTGVGQWNRVVRKLWTAAGVSPAPTIKIPSS